MISCWQLDQSERCTFETVLERLEAGVFNKSIVKETCNSIQPRALQLVKGDEVVVVENRREDMFGQNKMNQQFGTFPRSSVVIQTNIHLKKELVTSAIGASIAEDAPSSQRAPSLFASQAALSSVDTRTTADAEKPRAASSASNAQEADATPGSVNPATTATSTTTTTATASSSSTTA